MQAAAMQSLQRLRPAHGAPSERPPCSAAAWRRGITRLQTMRPTCQALSSTPLKSQSKHRRLLQVSRLACAFRSLASCIVCMPS